MDAAVKLTVLGSSTPFPRPDNPCSGYLLQFGDTSIWVDAGTGTLAELQRHTSITDLDAIWISHAHADHSADLLTAYYALRFSEFATTRPVPLIGPPALADRLTAFLGPSAKKGIPRAFDILEMKGWGDTTIGGIDLSWGPVNHGMPAFALRADASGHSVTYSGDTAPCESLIELATGTEVLLCEVGYDEPAPENAAHCTPEDAAHIASQAGVTKLVLTHITGTLTSAEAERRAGTIFAGEILSAHPGLELLRNSAR